MIHNATELFWPEEKNFPLAEHSGKPEFSRLELDTPDDAQGVFLTSTHKRSLQTTPPATPLRRLMETWAPKGDEEEEPEVTGPDPTDSGTEEMQTANTLPFPHT